MEVLLDIVRVIHIVNAVLMAWPFYALVAGSGRPARVTERRAQN